jgi:hypothetical protein
MKFLLRIIVFGVCISMIPTVHAMKGYYIYQHEKTKENDMVKKSYSVRRHDSRKGKQLSLTKSKDKTTNFITWHCKINDLFLDSSGWSETHSARILVLENKAARKCWLKLKQLSFEEKANHSL